MDRRAFNKLAGLGAMGALTPHLEMEALQASPSEGTSDIPPRKVEWPSQTYRRLLIDTHVPDWDPRLLADFDAVKYVSMIAEAGFQSFMQYANSHVGLCLWRTKIGQMHAGMKGRDYFGEVMAQCRRHELHRLAYYSLIFDDWAYQNHPEWRILPENGYDRILYSRTGTVCPNSPYREHAFACLRELVGNYDFEGIFLDMVFWPAVCYCPHCTVRFWREYHDEPPRIVNFNDPLWRSFQKAREAWMLEFAKAATQAIKQTRPVWVYQQFGTAFAAWQVGVSLEQREASDFCGGDFYGGAAQFSLVCKTYTSLTPKRPFEFMTSRTGPNLHDFETTKALQQILVESMVPTTSLPGTSVLAAVTLPWVAPDVGYTIGTRFAQIWSNPPAMVPGRDPGIVTNSFGKGKSIWVAAPIESISEPVYSSIVSRLLRDALPGPYCFELDADPAVEMTLLHQAQNHRFLVGLLNMPERLTTVAVSATVGVRLAPGRKPAKVLHLPDSKELVFEQNGPYVHFTVPPFKIATMAQVSYE